MARLVLRVERGGRLLGSWSLGDDPLEMSLHDLVTGEELGRFTASAGKGTLDELPVHVPNRATGDDLTMPLPERTDVGEALETTDGTGAAGGAAPPTRRPDRPVPNLARGLVDRDPPPVAPAAQAAAKAPELPLPAPPAALPEPAPAPSLSLLDRDRPTVASPRPPEPPPRPRSAMASTRDLFTGEATEVEGLPGYTEELSADLSLPLAEALVAEDTDDDDDLDDDLAETDDDDDLDAEELSLEESSAFSRPLPLPIAPAPTAEVPRTSLARPIFSTVRPAEVWVLRHNAWRSGGNIRPGQRATSRGGWVRLDSDGRLTILAGTELAGSGTLVDGRSVPIPTGGDAVRLPAGSSVLLRSGEHGIYVRSEPTGPRGRGPSPASGQENEPANGAGAGRPR